MSGIRKNSRTRGDTLIEVLFAVSVFSMVIVGSLAIMNQGTAASQRSLDITLVRQQVDAQAETLRFMHDSYVNVYRPDLDLSASATPAGEWFKMRRDVRALAATTTSDFNVGQTCPEIHPTGSFVLDPLNVVYYKATSSMKLAPTYARVSYTGVNKDVFNAAEGIWVEALQSSQGYVDFHIRACWDSQGLSVPMTIGTIVRLYDPKS